MLNRYRPMLAALIVLLGILPSVVAAGNEPATLQLSQTWQQGKQVTAYLDVRDERGLPITALDAARLHVTLGTQVAEVMEVEPVDTTGEGATARGEPLAPFDLAAQQTGPEQAAPVDTGPPVRLAFVTGPRRGEIMELPVATIARLGRAADCALVLAGNDEISGRHAELERLPNGQLVLRDLASTNGTRLNGVSVQGAHPLHDSDRIGLGQTELRMVS